MLSLRNVCFMVALATVSGSFGCGNHATDDLELMRVGAPLERPPGRRALLPGFVYTDGPRFMLDGNPFFFMGTNLYNIALLDGFDESEVDWTLAKVAGSGIKVVRIWGFANGQWEKSSPIQSLPNNYDQAALERLDFVLARAATYQLKLIVTLSNYESDYGGFQWYVDHFVGKGKPKELFYSDPGIRQSFKDYLKDLMGRRNTVSGRVYAEDPVVMAWELANEPHTSDDYEPKRGLPRGKLVYTWLAEMSEYLRSLAPSHLIASGEEGYRTESKSADFDWLNNGVKGVSFAANISLPYIDFGTLHAYPGNWGFHYEDRMWLFENYIGDRCRLAARAMNGRGKPIVIEEIGYRKDFGNRDELLNEVFDYANSVGVAGTMVWRMTPRPTDDSHDYDFDFTDEGAAAVFKQAKILNAKSGGAHSPSLGSPGLRSEGLGSLKTPK